MQATCNFVSPERKQDLPAVKPLYQTELAISQITFISPDNSLQPPHTAILFSYLFQYAFSKSHAVYMK